MDLVHVHMLEDSASYRGQAWSNGPLNSAMTEVFIDFLLDAPEGIAMGDSLFEPGGILEFLPSYTKQPDGTMKRNPPPLRLAQPFDLA